MKCVFVAFVLLLSQELVANELRTPTIPNVCRQYEDGNIEQALNCVRSMRWTTNEEAIMAKVLPAAVAGGVVGGIIGIALMPASTGPWSWASVAATFTTAGTYIGVGAIVGAAIGGGLVLVFVSLPNSPGDSSLQSYYVTNTGFQEFLKLTRDQQLIFIQSFQPQILIELLHKVASEARAELLMRSR